MAKDNRLDARIDAWDNTQKCVQNLRNEDKQID